MSACALEPPGRLSVETWVMDVDRQQPSTKLLRLFNRTRQGWLVVQP